MDHTHGIAATIIAHFAMAHAPRGDILRARPSVYGPLCIGHDHTRGALNDQVITAGEAETLLQADLGHIRAELEKKLNPTPRREINDHQRAALISFAHSLGLHTFAQTTVLDRVNSRRYIDVVPEIMKHTQANGRPLRILHRRRLSEANLFCSFPGWLVTS